MSPTLLVNRNRLRKGSKLPRCRIEASCWLVQKDNFTITHKGNGKTQPNSEYKGKTINILNKQEGLPSTHPSRQLNCRSVPSFIKANICEKGVDMEILFGWINAL
jgi:hypothetical protein